uniref:Uncharacterized protein n=1 Tax=Romanomermis culicivorax TaxID=13658 RepID=A0A915J6M7_ROMCU
MASNASRRMATKGVIMAMLACNWTSDKLQKNIIGKGVMPMALRRNIISPRIPYCEGSRFKALGNSKGNKKHKQLLGFCFLWICVAPQWYPNRDAAFAASMGIRNLQIYTKMYSFSSLGDFNLLRHLMMQVPCPGSLQPIPHTQGQLCEEC